MDKIRLYKEYLSSNISEFDLIIRIDKLQNKEKKEKGVVYTPFSVVQKMIEISKPTKDIDIIEPSCGHGAFLFGLLNYMKKKYNLSGKELFKWFIYKVTAIELSKDTVEDLKDMLSLYFLKHFNLHLKNNEFINIKNEDALYYKGLPKYDLCLGNPPYIRTKNLEIDYLNKLRKEFKSCEKGNIDIYYAFIEKFGNMSSNLCLITPNSFLTNLSAVKVREWVGKRVTHLIDFKEKIIFSDARTYTCIFNCSNSNNIKDNFLYSNEIDDSFIVKNRNSFFNEKQTNNNFIVLSGLATLCDSIYLVKKNGKKFYALFENKKYEIEKKILAPYLKLSKIKNNDLSNINYMIYPYDKNKKIINEEILKNEYPLTYKYLLIVKNRLKQRDKGKVENYESWYAYGRKQGLHTIVSEKVIAIPQMIRSDCRPVLLSIKNLLKEFEKIVFTSGYIVPVIDNNEIDIFMSNNFLEFAKYNGKAWPGKGEPYHSLTVKQIRGFTLD